MYIHASDAIKLFTQPSTASRIVNQILNRECVREKMVQKTYRRLEPLFRILEKLQNSYNTVLAAGIACTAVPRVYMV